MIHKRNFISFSFFISFLWGNLCLTFCLISKKLSFSDQSAKSNKVLNIESALDNELYERGIPGHL